jgi:hypothetical protein
MGECADLCIGDRLVSTLDHMFEPEAATVRRLEVITELADVGGSRTTTRRGSSKRRLLLVRWFRRLRDATGCLGGAARVPKASGDNRPGVDGDVQRHRLAKTRGPLAI